MYLVENLKRLNKKYNPMGIVFKKDGDIIDVIETTDWVLNNNPSLKKMFQVKFKLIFKKPKPLWYIGAEGIAILESRSIKFEPSKTVDEMKKEFQQFLDSIEEDSLRTSIEKFLAANEFFFEAPASIYPHHDYGGGLLEHTVQVLKLALLVVKNLDEDILVDKDLIIAGIILHDIGKINCYQIENEVISRTQIYFEQNHIINGVKIVSQNIVSEKLDEIIHIIASHHNLAQWGSPVEPKCNEAWIVHFIENLSSKIMG